MNIAKVADLIQTALTNTDVDKQYMAARDLCDELQVYYGKVQIEEENGKLNEVYEVYYRHLSSQYRDIQGNAIKCIQTLAPLMKSKEIKFIAPLLLNSSIKESADYRDNYHICLQELIDKIASPITCLTELCGDIIQQFNSLRIQHKNLNVSKQIVHKEIQQCIQIQSELLRILSSIMQRWPDLCRFDISQMLFENILHQNEVSIRKNSCVCLGVYGLCLEKQQLNQLIEQKIIANLNNQKYDTQGFHNTLYINQSLNYLAKTSACKFDINLIKAILKVFYQTLNENGSVDLDLINNYAEIVDLQMLTIIYLLSNPLMREFDCDFIEKIFMFIEFDPMNLTTVVESNDYGYDDDYYVDDAQDNSWRVRRCVVQALYEVVKIQPQLFKMLLGLCFSENDRIMTRLNEKNQEIRSIIIQFLISLVQASAITQDVDNMMEIEISLVRQRSMDSSITKELFILKLLTKIQQIFDDPTEQQQLKSDSNKLLLTIAQYFQQTIQESEECLKRIVLIAKSVLQGQQQHYTNEQRITSSIALKLLSKFHNLNAFHHPILFEICKILLETNNQKYIRIVVESHQALDNAIIAITRYSHDQLQFYQQLIIVFKNQLMDRIKIDNLDQEIKVALIQSLMTLLKCLPQLFQLQDYEVISTMAQQRLQLDQLTSTILNLILLLPQFPSATNLITIITNLIPKQDKGYKAQVYQSLITLIANNNITIQQAEDIIVKLKNTQLDYFELQIQVLTAILSKQPIVLPEAVIQESIKQACSLGKAKPEIQLFFQSVNQYQVIESQLLKLQLTKEDLQIAGLIWAGAIKSLPNVQDALQRIYSTIHENRPLKLSALRYLHREYNVDQVVINLMCTLIARKEDGDLAALVLGSSARSVDIIKNLIKDHPNQYLYFYAIKEFAEGKQSVTQTKDLVSYLIQEVSNKDKVITSIVGEILGHLLITHQADVEPLLFNSLQDQSLSVKQACIQSLKYSQHWASKSKILVDMLGSEQDLTLLAGIVKALTQVASVTKLSQLLPNLSKCLKRFEERELDFGNFKEKRDDAKDLRSLSFDLLEICLDKQELNLDHVVDVVIDKFDEDKYDETRVPRLRILQKLSVIDNRVVRQHCAQLTKSFAPILKQFNILIAKQDNSMDKEVEKNKLIINILKPLQDDPAVQVFYSQYITKQILDQLKK